MSVAGPSGWTALGLGSVRVPRDALVMVLDDAGGGLGALSVALVKGGVDVVYAADLDELILLAREQPHPSVLLLAPNVLALRVLGKLAKALGLAPEAVLPWGSRPGDAEIEAFRAAGLRWSVWDCPNPEAAQYVVAAALWDLDKSELRFEARMPTELPGMLYLEGGSERMTVLDLGGGGIRVRCGRPLAPDAEVALRFRLAAREIEAGARVTWTRAGAGSSSDAGLAFERFEGDAEKRIRAEVSAWLARHRIAAREPAPAPETQPAEAPPAADPTD